MLARLWRSNSSDACSCVSVRRQQRIESAQSSYPFHLVIAHNVQSRPLLMLEPGESNQRAERAGVDERHRVEVDGDVARRPSLKRSGCVDHVRDSRHVELTDYHDVSGHVVDVDVEVAVVGRFLERLGHLIC
jgi:hypothetical protein